jgi:hypothetical protein
MNRLYAIGALMGAILFAATPAMAMLKVTNLSDKMQTVVFDSAGSKTHYVIASGATERLGGAEGFLSLVGAKPTAGDISIIGTRSTLFGLTDSARSRGVPASPMDSFVIWPDGRLSFQKRTHYGRGN